jgi:hypothetical protein
MGGFQSRVRRYAEKTNPLLLTEIETLFLYRPTVTDAATERQGKSYLKLKLMGNIRFQQDSFVKERDSHCDNITLTMQWLFNQEY